MAARSGFGGNVESLVIAGSIALGVWVIYSWVSSGGPSQAAQSGGQAAASSIGSAISQGISNAASQAAQNITSSGVNYFGSEIETEVCDVANWSVYAIDPLAWFGYQNPTVCVADGGT